MYLFDHDLSIEKVSDEMCKEVANRYLGIKIKRIDVQRVSGDEFVNIFCPELTQIGEMPFGIQLMQNGSIKCNGSLASYKLDMLGAYNMLLSTQWNDPLEKEPEHNENVVLKMSCGDVISAKFWKSNHSSDRYFLVDGGRYTNISCGMGWFPAGNVKM